MRTKTKVNKIELLIEATHSSSPDKFVVAETHADFLDSVTYSDDITRWREAIKNRNSATTHLTGVERSVARNSFRISQEFISEFADPVERQKFSLFGDVCAGVGFPTPMDDSLSRVDNQAIMGVTKKILAAQRTVQGLVSLGEIRELAHAIRNPAQSLWRGLNAYHRDAVRTAKRLKPRGTRKMSKAIAGTWLEYAFGWQPLVNDIQGAAEALARIQIYDVPHKVVSYTAKDAFNIPTYDLPIGIGPIAVHRKVSDRHEVSVKYKFCVMSQPPTIAGNLSKFGISLRELVPTVWELIPYSFLVDYFTNVGDVLSSLAVNSASIAWGERGQMISAKRTVMPSFSPGDVGFGWLSTETTSSLNGKGVTSERQVQRTAALGVPAPSLEFEIPGLSRKWLNIGALLASSKRASKSLASSG